MKMIAPARFRHVIDTLYPAEITHLTYDSARPWTFLFAVILSAQCTDARVNIVTPTLFADFPDLESFVARPIEDIERTLSSINFYRNKAKSLKACAGQLLLRHDGKIPRTMREMVSLAGVGRKTANVALSVLYGINEGFTVDTHIKRIAFRVGHTRATDPIKVEPDLMRRHPRARWGSMAHKMVQFGRDVCRARKPRCASCPLYKECPRRGM